MKTKIFLMMILSVLLINRIEGQTVSFVFNPLNDHTTSNILLLGEDIFLSGGYVTFFYSNSLWIDDYSCNIMSMSGVKKPDNQNLVYVYGFNGQGFGNLFRWNDSAKKWNPISNRPSYLEYGAIIKVIDDTNIYLLSQNYSFPRLNRYNGNSYEELFIDTSTYYEGFLYADNVKVIFSRMSTGVISSYLLEQDTIIDLISISDVQGIQDFKSANGKDFFILSREGNLYQYNIETQVLTDLIICSEEEKGLFSNTLETFNGMVFVAGKNGIKKIQVLGDGSISSEVIYVVSHNEYYVKSSSRFGPKIIFAGSIGENINGSISSAIISVDCSVGVVEPPVIPEVNIYPNPTKDQIKIDGLIEPSNVQVFDIYGKLVLAQEYQDNEEINISNLNVGVYILQVRNSKGVFSQKLIKQ
jgi:hypothetical protein